MNTSNVKGCIATLQKLRDACHGQLDARVLGELEYVISELRESVRDGEQSTVNLGGLGLRALEVINAVLKLVTNVSDLMK